MRVCKTGNEVASSAGRHPETAKGHAGTGLRIPGLMTCYGLSGTLSAVSQMTYRRARVAAWNDVPNVLALAGGGGT
jgi:hypothetical protein